NHKKLDTRVHYTVLKQHEHHPHNQPPRLVTRDSIPTGTTTHAIPDTQQRNKPNNKTRKHNNTHQQPTGHRRTRKQTPTKRVSNAHDSPTKIINKKLLRKEVIQPHLPVRLPCYDFVPIADPTFDSSLTSLGHWLRVLPTFMT